MTAFPSVDHIGSHIATARVSKQSRARLATSGYRYTTTVGAHLSDSTPQGSRSSSAVLNLEGGPLCVYINGHRLVLVRRSL